MNRFEEYSPVVVRGALALLFLWFGISQVLQPDAWVAWVPPWPTELTGLSAETIVLMNGGFEVVFGILLALGLLTRVAALLLSLHLFFIAFEIGYNDIGVRDFVLALCTMGVALAVPDRFTLDRMWKRE